MEDSQPNFRRTYTGLEHCYPVELLIASVEYKFAEPMDQFEATMKHMSSDDTTPAGKWRAQMSETVEDLQTWQDLKSNLLSTLGRKRPFSIREKLQFVVSLKKEKSEQFSAFLHRVQWVIENVVQSKDVCTWTTILFLLGVTSCMTSQE